jgi:hypothetical protein
MSIHGPTMPLHIACMYHLSHLHSKLFILAHEMVDHEPENPVSWYAVGVWYLCRGKWAQARQYFRLALPVTAQITPSDRCGSKTSLMDPRFGPAWIAFAHTFALESEHDHAVTAYSTCARMFTGSVVLFLHHTFIIAKLCFQFAPTTDFRWNGTYHVVKQCIGRRGTERRIFHVQRRPSTDQRAWRNGFQPWRVSFFRFIYPLFDLNFRSDMKSLLHYFKRP